MERDFTLQIKQIPIELNGGLFENTMNSSNNNNMGTKFETPKMQSSTGKSPNSTKNSRSRQKHTPSTTSISCNTTFTTNTSRNYTNTTNTTSRSTNIQQVYRNPFGKRSQPPIETQIVHVSHIESPHNFFVQTDEFYAYAETFIQICSNSAEYEPQPNPPILNELYLIQWVAYKQSVFSWFRGIIKSCNNNVYVAFLVDFGLDIKVEAKK